jgi:outer membrane protein assembly factor BamB
MPAPSGATKIEDNDAWSCYASPQPLGDIITVLISRRGLLGLDGESGEIAWETKLPVEYHYASPVAAGNHLVSGGDRGSLALLEADKGEIIWQGGELQGPYPTGITVVDDHIYSSTSGGVVQCNELKSGDLHWTFGVGRDILDMTPYARGVNSVLARPLVVGNRVVVSGCDGFLYVLDRSSGALIDRIFLASPMAAAPCQVGDRIFVGTYAGRLYCISLG